MGIFQCHVSFRWVIFNTIFVYLQPLRFSLIMVAMKGESYRASVGALDFSLITGLVATATFVSRWNVDC